MGHRTHNTPRCERCRMHEERCLCEFIPSYELETRLVLVMHCRETEKPTATGPLALAALKNSELHLQGLPHQPLDLTHLHEQGRRVVVLFPADDAVELTPQFRAQDPRPVTLVVPDGNWRQASRVPKRVPGLQNAERVVLPQGRPTQWGIRRETREGGLATFEAIARAFGQLESPEIQEGMESVFHRMVETTLSMRGYEKDGTPK